MLYNLGMVILTRIGSQHEKFVQPADNHNITGQYNASAHSTKGIVQTSLPGFAFPSDPRVINTTKELPDLFPFNLDHNDGGLLGVAWSQGTVGHPAERSSSATSYLGDEYLNRPNMHVLVNAQVTKLIQTGTVNGLPSFHSVQFGNGTSSSGMSSVITVVRVHAHEFNRSFLCCQCHPGDHCLLWTYWDPSSPPIVWHRGSR